MQGEYGTTAHRQSQQNGYQENHQCVCRTDRRQRPCTNALAYNERICNVVALLQKDPTSMGRVKCNKVPVMPP